ncbi:MAG: hypothetical protein NTX13_17905 [Acidobacteria bacterium]|nr:hypothetical protein [Acidobacteriota bacterium]
MQCLQCGVAMALLHKLRNATTFCSEECRRKYQDESNQLAMSRLMHHRRPKLSSHHAKASSDTATVGLVSAGDLPLASFLPLVALACIDTQPVAPPLDWEQRSRSEVFPTRGDEVLHSLLALEFAQLQQQYPLLGTPLPVRTELQPMAAPEVLANHAPASPVASTVKSAAAGKRPKKAKAAETPKRLADEPATRKIAAPRRERRRAENKQDKAKAALEPVIEKVAEVVVPAATPAEAVPIAAAAPVKWPEPLSSPASETPTQRSPIGELWGRAPRWQRVAMAGVVLCSLGAGVGALLRNSNQQPAPSRPPFALANAGLPFDTKDWSEERATDQVGAAMDRRFSLYRQSKARKDYAIDFEAAIDQRPLNWVVRAQDGENYYCMKLQWDPSGTAKLVRFAVIHGKQDRQTQIALAKLPMPSAGWYGVRVEASGATIKTLINGTVVDAWVDSRLAQGAAGFTTERGEQAVIRSARVSFPVESKTPSKGEQPQAKLFPLSLPVLSPIPGQSVLLPIESSHLAGIAASTASSDESECARQGSIILAHWQTPADKTTTGELGVCQLQMSALAAYQASFAEAFSGPALQGETN